MSELVPITNPPEMKAAGLPFETEDAARWAFRQRHKNGLAGGFVRIGRRIYADVPKLIELARKNST